MVEFEEKFFVINRKHIENAPPYQRGLMNLLLNQINRFAPFNKYYICNQDEPYAGEVLRVILEGEEAKMNG
jgi:hypothetical protein